MIPDHPSVPIKFTDDVLLLIGWLSGNVVSSSHTANSAIVEEMPFNALEPVLMRRGIIVCDCYGVTANCIETAVQRGDGQVSSPPRYEGHVLMPRAILTSLDQCPAQQR
jgi:hypothetical protein